MRARAFSTIGVSAALVTVNREKLPFRKTSDGAYSIELPSDKQLGGQRRITCEWRLPISELKHESGLYWTRPRSLIPVVYYELRASVGPQSGFDLIGEPAKERGPAYSWNGDRPAIEFDVGGGVCALPIRERE